MQGRVIVISGPSGSGKTSVCARLLEADARFVPSISATTRAPRGGEEEGVHYFFLSEDAFRAGIDAGRFLEWAEVYGRLYGTPREAVERRVAEGKLVVLNIDVQGAARLRERGLEAIYVFLMPPSPAELEKRLRGRRTDRDDVIAKRLAVAAFEMAEAGKYDKIVINDDLERAAAEVRGFVYERIGEAAPGARKAASR
jgi:guanylate kinase